MNGDTLWEQHWWKHRPTRGELWIAAQRHQILTQIVSDMDHEFRREMVIVEAGCGVGHDSFLMADSCRVLAFDVSRAALRQHRALYPLSKACTILANIVHLPLPAASVDVVFNAGVMEHFTDPEKAIVLREFRRVLRPAGRLFVTVPGRYSFWHLYRLLLRRYDFGYEEYHTPRSFAAILAQNGWETIGTGGIDPLTMGTFCRRFFGITLPACNLPGGFSTEVYLVARPKTRPVQCSR